MDHRQLCLDIRYGLLVFRRALEISAHNKSKNIALRVKLGVTGDTIDMIGHWWNAALCVHAQTTCKSVSFLLDNSSYAQSYVNASSIGDLEKMTRMVDFFKYNAAELVPQIKLYTGYVVKALSGRTETIGQFVVRYVVLKFME